MARKNNQGKGKLKIVFILFLFVLGVIFVKWPAILSLVKLPTSSVNQILPKPISETDVFNQINAYRTANKMVALSRNEKLDKAALSRLTVIKNNQDFTGEKTGTTLENAVKNNGYNYSTSGEITISGVSGETKIAEELIKAPDQKKVLENKDFRDIGVAVVSDGLNYRVMIVMAKQMTVRVEKVGAGGYPIVTWGGPELWEAINKRRVELGVGTLSKRDELCTIASIRLNQLLELGKLDGHAGFEPLLNRPDLASIRNKYNLAEYLIVGYLTPAEAVAGWEHTLGHRGLLAGGEYVWGCVYSQNTFAVAIAAY